mmetsp:Transcript_3519/g.8614  ORF Transcript_3519/g.8614 Transcript_3519/m.8614 type:complete len:230 (+) Transcript_3519:570-1259(+)
MKRCTKRKEFGHEVLCNEQEEIVVVSKPCDFILEVQARHESQASRRCTKVGLLGGIKFLLPIDEAAQEDIRDRDRDALAIVCFHCHIHPDKHHLFPVRQFHPFQPNRQLSLGNLTLLLLRHGLLCTLGFSLLFSLVWLPTILCSHVVLYRSDFLKFWSFEIRTCCRHRIPFPLFLRRVELAVHDSKRSQSHSLQRRRSSHVQHVTEAEDRKFCVYVFQLIESLLKVCKI